MNGVWLWLYHGLQWTWGGTPFRAPQTGYNLLSGPVGDITLLGGAWMLWRKHACYEPHCFRLGFKPHPDDPEHIICRRHHARVTEAASGR